MIPIKDINPTERFPFVTVLLIVVNTAVFLYGALLGKQSEEMFVASFSLVPARLFFPDAAPGGAITAWVTIFTSMFLHGGSLHIAGNMLYLWIFGNNIEDAMGRMRFVFFYLLSGVAAAFSHALSNTASIVPMIGASGAISGVLGAYLLLYPRARVLTLMVFGFFVRRVEIPAMFVLGFWFVFQFLSALVSPGSGGGIAWYAHIGGFIAGMVLIGIFKRNDVPFGGGRGYRQL
ncbi:MAG: rhomboid family intramembrane serine protease [Nitrospirae bacterium RBG_19FT_COMBO_55_12]|nr:MAG: rhomboid family intramembrane serine protease [Nitrospirae bacterium RBG_19FT_COMBO_55_12]